MYMASEVGVANVAADEVIQKHRLKPGRLLLVDTKRGVFVKDDVIKEEITNLRPVASWIEQEVSDCSFLINAHRNNKQTHNSNNGTTHTWQIFTHFVTNFTVPLRDSDPGPFALMSATLAIRLFLPHWKLE